MAAAAGCARGSGARRASAYGTCGKRLGGGLSAPAQTTVRAALLTAQAGHVPLGAARTDVPNLVARLTAWRFDAATTQVHMNVHVTAASEAHPHERQRLVNWREAQQTCLCRHRVALGKVAQLALTRVQDIPARYWRLDEQSVLCGGHVVLAPAVVIEGLQPCQPPGRISGVAQICARKLLKREQIALAGVIMLDCTRSLKRGQVDRSEPAACGVVIHESIELVAHSLPRAHSQMDRRFERPSLRALHDLATAYSCWRIHHDEATEA